MSIWKLWRKPRSEPEGAASRHQAVGEPFEYEVKMIYVPPRENVRVWKTRSLSADATSIYLEPPQEEWEISLPHDTPITIYLMDTNRVSEFDSVLERVARGGARLLKARRPEPIEWKHKDGAGHQNRRYLRVTVALPAQCALVVPTTAGRGLQMSDAHRSRLVDLSVEGASLLTDLASEVGALVELKVLSHSFPLTVQAKVIRCGEAPRSSRAEFSHTMAVIFQNLAPVTRDMIGQFILEKQKEQGA